MTTETRKIAVITGGAGGLGLAIARRLHAKGNQIVLWDLNEEHARQAAATLSDAVSMKVDVTSQVSIEEAVRQTVGEFGGIDILVNSAGITGPNQPLVDYTLNQWRQVMAINLEGTFLCCRAVVPVMTKSEAGRIVNMASIAGKEGNPNGSAYSAAKAGVIALTKSLGKELVNTPIRVNCIAPAAIETEILKQMTPEFTKSVVGKIPLGRLGQPDEVAAVAEFLASPDCTFCTGACFDASGGRATY
jgi:3-oxoacyl-[acyl-carrier protein] reductase